MLANCICPQTQEEPIEEHSWELEEWVSLKMKKGQKVREKTERGVSGILSIFLMCFDSSFVLIGRKK